MWSTRNHFSVRGLETATQTDFKCIPLSYGCFPLTDQERETVLHGYWMDIS